MCVALFRHNTEGRGEAKSNNSFPSVKIASNFLVIPTAEAIKQRGASPLSMTNLMTGALPISQSLFPVYLENKIDKKDHDKKLWQSNIWIPPDITYQRNSNSWKIALKSWALLFLVDPCFVLSRRENHFASTQVIFHTETVPELHLKKSLSQSASKRHDV